MRLLVRAPGVLLESAGEAWLAFSELSGESHVLNHESVAVLEVLDTLHSRSESDVCDRLAAECGDSVDHVQAAMRNAWDDLLAAGLVRQPATNCFTAG